MSICVDVFVYVGMCMYQGHGGRGGAARVSNGCEIPYVFAGIFT